MWYRSSTRILGVELADSRLAKLEEAVVCYWQSFHANAAA
jgi:hypothetical protein